MRKINSSLTVFDCVSIFITTVFCVVMAVYFYESVKTKRVPVVYQVASSTSEGNIDVRPFGSIQGTTYTFAWCQNGKAILQKNKILFKNEDDAKKHGRTLSKLCK